MSLEELLALPTVLDESEDEDWDSEDEHVQTGGSKIDLGATYLLRPKSSHKYEEGKELLATMPVILVKDGSSYAKKHSLADLTEQEIAAIEGMNAAAVLKFLEEVDRLDKLALLRLTPVLNSLWYDAAQAERAKQKTAQFGGRQFGGGEDKKEEEDPLAAARRQYALFALVHGLQALAITSNHPNAPLFKETSLPDKYRWAKSELEGTKTVAGVERKVAETLWKSIQTDYIKMKTPISLDTMVKYMKTPADLMNDYVKPDIDPVPKAAPIATSIPVPSTEEAEEEEEKESFAERAATHTSSAVEKKAAAAAATTTIPTTTPTTIPTTTPGSPAATKNSFLTRFTRKAKAMKDGTKQLFTRKAKASKPTQRSVAAATAQPSSTTTTAMTTRASAAPTPTPTPTPAPAPQVTEVPKIIRDLFDSDNSQFNKLGIKNRVERAIREQSGTMFIDGLKNITITITAELENKTISPDVVDQLREYKDRLNLIKKAVSKFNTKGFYDSEKSAYDGHKSKLLTEFSPVIDKLETIAPPLTVKNRVARFTRKFKKPATK